MKKIRVILEKSKMPIKDMINLLDMDRCSKEIKKISDFTFSQYVIVMQNPKMFARLQINTDRKIALPYLEKIKETRNDMMHFSPNDIDSEYISHLRDTANLFSTILKNLP